MKSTSAEQTKQIAKKFASKLTDGDIVLLHGELGSGKTTFVKGLAKSFGVEENITSPTFTLMNIYKIKSPKSKVKSLIHIDTYRLEKQQELIDIGVEDYLGNKNTVCIIEWPEKIANLLKNYKTKNVHFEHVDENIRKIIIKD